MEKIKEYYIKLISLSGEESNDFGKIFWKKYEEIKLKAENLRKAKIEARKIYLTHKESQIAYVKNKFIDFQIAELVKSFPAQMTIIEKIERHVSI